ncbi:MAG TPA: YdeI/OmpD-associated family protein [Pyrinomonadaceae bacterium]|nr:YdeI/OmpD-associated family protein [Pyrinomonadaceae bacterium]
MNSSTETTIKSFTTQQKWREWLANSHSKSDGIWLRIFKKDSGKKTVTHDQAVDEALCFGWIDGQRNKHDEVSFLQKFTQRRKRSIWSKRNREKALKLIKEGRMTTAGRAEIERAKNDGRWDQAYDSPKNMEMPADFIKELKKNHKAYEFFQTLNKTNKFAIAFRLHTAKKPETRERRMNDFLARMERGEKFH